ncbi:DUF2283 domain-containing protein [Desulfonema magnum]|uniref:DUF2283 domain-containing protein n=1 Tax=Desulfonema magnum TaxID=45655 RepID=A0A975GR77_9BACT|nr:DUF2283 domain-containing protein [Desulfonema magnum]QTA90627.1 Uncharacterized protein dnm_066880 [Desulfonema magnum]
MSDIRSYEAKTESAESEDIRLVYDEDMDTLDIFFGQNEPATGVELTDHILLRLNRTTGCAVSLTFLHFSILTEQTEYGPRSYPLDKLGELPEDLRESAIRAVSRPPVNQFLKMSFFQESSSRHIPLTYVEQVPKLVPEAAAQGA